MSFLSFQLEKTGTNKDLLNSKQAFSVFFKHWQRTMYYPLLLKKWLPQVHWNYMNLANFTKKLSWIKKKYHHNILPWVTLSILKQMWNNYCLTYFLSQNLEWSTSIARSISDIKFSIIKIRCITTSAFKTENEVVKIVIKIWVLNKILDIFSTTFKVSASLSNWANQGPIPAHESYSKILIKRKNCSN